MAPIRMSTIIPTADPLITAVLSPLLPSATSAVAVVVPEASVAPGVVIVLVASVDTAC